MLHFPTASPRLWPRAVLIMLVRGYRLLLSPWLGNACRFEPTCSRYAIEALARHGAVAGTALAAGRILRCAPWCEGGCDPVPAQRPRLFSRLLRADPAPTPTPAAALDPLNSSRPLP
jgi:uncharacterized protein